MKSILIHLVALILALPSLNAQSKKEIIQQNEILKRQLILYEIKLDSTDKENMRNLHFINHFIDKYVPDSLELKRPEARVYLDSLMMQAFNAEATEAFRDSLSLLSDSLEMVQASADSVSETNTWLKNLMELRLEKTNYPQSAADYQGEWLLFVDPLYLAKDSMYTALLTYNRLDLPEWVRGSMFSKIIFMEDDLAELHFMDGRHEKCFYDVWDFSKTRNYIIHFNRKDDSGIALLVNHLPEGIQVSYELKQEQGDNVFYYGYMKPK